MCTEKNSFFCSWSGGKDSSLALHRAMLKEGAPSLMFTVMTEGGEKSKSHGLPLSLLEKQAESIGSKLVVKPATWDSYEDVFHSTLLEFKKQNINLGVFGDIDIDRNRQWVEDMCNKAGIKAQEPLWKEKRRDLLEEFINKGFKAVIISIKDELLSKDFLGKTLDLELIKKLEESGIDPSGEEGEYHTVVVDGPIFSFPIDIKLKDKVYYSGYWFQNVEL